MKSLTIAGTAALAVILTGGVALAGNDNAGQQPYQYNVGSGAAQKGQEGYQYNVGSGAAQKGQESYQYNVGSGAAQKGQEPYQYNTGSGSAQKTPGGPYTQGATTTPQNQQKNNQ